MLQIARLTGFAGVFSSAAIFGFFYAWVCSTMWGLDTLHPRVAIEAMQAMNASVRNAVFAPSFFGTSPILLVAAGLAAAAGRPKAAIIFGFGGVFYALGGIGLTMLVNVPMNEALAAIDLGLPDDRLAVIWSDYSPEWQMWNQIRTVVSGIVVLVAGWGLVSLSQTAK